MPVNINSAKIKYMKIELAPRNLLYEVLSDKKIIKNNKKIKYKLNKMPWNAMDVVGYKSWVSLGKK